MAAVLCENCGKPFDYYTTINNVLVRINGTARVFGIYKKDRKIVEKVYAHYPSCENTRLRPVRIVI